MNLNPIKIDYFEILANNDANIIELVKLKDHELYKANRGGDNLLMMACLLKKKNCAQILFATNKFDLKQKNDCNCTLLFFACYANFIEIVDKLLTKTDINIDPNQINNHLVTPLILACKGSADKTALRLLSCDTIYKTINQIDKDGECALSYAAKGDGNMYKVALKILTFDIKIDANNINNIIDHISSVQKYKHNKTKIESEIESEIKFELERCQLLTILKNKVDTIINENVIII